MKKIILFLCAALFLLGIAMNLQYAVNDYDFKTNSIHSVILAQDGTGTGTGTGGSNYKICYYKGNSTFSDYYSCEKDYPDIGACGNTGRQNKWFSSDKSSCTED